MAEQSEATEARVDPEDLGDLRTFAAGRGVWERVFPNRPPPYTAVGRAVDALETAPSETPTRIRPSESPSTRPVTTLAEALTRVPSIRAEIAATAKPSTVAHRDIEALDLVIEAARAPAPSQTRDDLAARLELVAKNVEAIGRGYTLRRRDEEKLPPLLREAADALARATQEPEEAE